MKRSILIILLMLLPVPAFAYFGSNQFGMEKFGIARFGVGSFGEAVPTSGGAHGSSILMETGDYLLLETGDSILTE